MKECIIYSTAQSKSAKGVIINNRVLLPDANGKYVPPCYVAEFAKNLNFDLVPFSTECEWGEYGAVDSPVHNCVRYHSGIDDYAVKCGYCDTKTGEIRIPPEMGYCGDFNKYGKAIVGDPADPDDPIRDGVYSWIMDTSGDFDSTGYVGIKESYHGVFFVYQTADGWGAIDSDGYVIIEPLCHEIEWDGLGGFTIENRRNGKISFAILNGDNSGGSNCEVTRGLTEKPIIVYDFPPSKMGLPWEDEFDCKRYRLTQRDDKFGLIVDVIDNPYRPHETYSELLLEPGYNLNEIPDAAYASWRDGQIRHYAHVIECTPQEFPHKENNGWELVPEDIRGDVRKYMELHSMKSHDTTDEN